MTNASSLSALLASDIPDPSDFPPLSSAPGLRILDSSLRCNICSELFDAPVTLQCGHCFCSVCIRSSIGGKPECPNCRKDANEGHLRVNPAMEEVVAAWKDARSYVLRLSKDDVAPTFRPPIKTSKKRKRGSVPTSPARPEELEVSEDETFSIPTSDPREEDMPTPSNGNVVCPVCNRLIPLAGINTHIDNGCPSPSTSSSSEKKAEKKKATVGQWGKLLAGSGGSSKSGKGKEKAPPPTAISEPLPKVSYAILKDRQIKELLADFELPVTGGRESWIGRHQRWVIIYNANLDRAPHLQLTIQSLRKDLKRWEEVREKKGNLRSIDVVEHQKANRDEFGKLVEAARPKGIRKQNDTKNNPPTPRTQPAIEDDAIVLDSEEERGAAECFAT